MDGNPFDHEIVVRAGLDSGAEELSGLEGRELEGGCGAASHGEIGGA